MVLTPSNYRIYYNVRYRIPFRDISVEMTDEFIEYLKHSEINKNNKDRYEQIALNAMKAYKNYKDFIKDAKSDSICEWDGGLLTKILIPYGNACVLAYEETEHFGCFYRSHNIDGDHQASVILAVITRYLSDNDLRLSE